MVNKEACFTSNSDEWETPRETYDRLDHEFHFDLDPCCTTDNQKCCCGYHIEDDGLAIKWSGKVFMNPPYSQGKKWIEKAYNEVKSGNCRAVVALLPARTDRIAFHKYIYHKAEIRFIKGRLKFSGSKHPAPFPSMIVIWRAM